MEGVRSRGKLAATKDHVVPKSKGGNRTVWSCRQCNSIKRDMMPEDWSAFMASYPRWWEHKAFKDIGKGQQHKQQTFYNPSLRIGREPTIPTAVPLEYPDDPKAQAAFQAVYDHRLHMLRITPTPTAGQ